MIQPIICIIANRAPGRPTARDSLPSASIPWLACAGFDAGVAVEDADDAFIVVGEYEVVVGTAGCKVEGSVGVAVVVEQVDVPPLPAAIIWPSSIVLPPAYSSQIVNIRYAEAQTMSQPQLTPTDSIEFEMKYPVFEQRQSSIVVM